MRHQIGGRKLGRMQGPRLALYKNLIVSVLRYEKVMTTEAKAKEIRPQVERMITLAKRGDLSARRTGVAISSKSFLMTRGSSGSSATTVRRAERSPRLASVIIRSTCGRISLAFASVVITFS